MAPLTHEELSAALREALRASLDEARAFDPPPTLDLAVVAFPEHSPAVWANVLVTRGHHAGVVARIGDDASSVQDIQFLVDPTDAARRSLAWQPGADWTQIPGLKTLQGQGPFRSIAPYPASLIKLMVAVGVGLLVDQGRTGWSWPWSWQGRSRPVLDWMHGMITESRNDDTSALVALLHAGGLIGREGPIETVNLLHEAFSSLGLHTLRLANTQADGGWLNRDGAGVGHLQMTAWDTARLLWVMLHDAGHTTCAPPWLGSGSARLLSPASAQRLWNILDEQALHTVLSSTALAGIPGWRRGIPARLPERWIDPRGGVAAADQQWPGDVRPTHREARVRFAHKTGTTENYLSDAGWVRTLRPGGRSYLIALLSSLGSRHAPDPRLSTDWCIPALGARIDDWLSRRLG